MITCTKCDSIMNVAKRHDPRPPEQLTLTHIAWCPVEGCNTWWHVQDPDKKEE